MELSMPYIHIQVSGDPDDSLAAKIAASASDLTARILGKDPALTAVVIDFIAASRWFIAGSVLTASTKRSYHWSVSITDETNTKAEKARYMRDVHEEMNRLLGGVADHSYIYVIDARAAAYGWGGETQEHRYQHA